MVNTLVRYEKDNPGYVRSTWQRNFLRPFLTPSSGLEMEDEEIKHLKHPLFVESIRKLEVKENVYFPRENQEREMTTTYYAHVGRYKRKAGNFVVFANWDAFLEKYYLTVGDAKRNLVEGDKLIESFKNYAPTFYFILRQREFPVTARKNFSIRSQKMNVLCIEVESEEEIEKAEETLVNACLQLCLEINGSAHLAVWRRYLESVWLHK